jgi:cellulose synthase/poly-beta-1,6-N-acetylglucosamine synthase-like glycosyltransferase
MITCFKFKDMIDIAYHSNTDTLYLSLSDSWLQENSLFKNSKDYMLEYEKRTTDNKEDLENNIVSVILKLYHEEDFCYISGCYFEHFVSRFNKKIGVYDYDWDSFLRVFKKQPLLKFTELIIGNSEDINDEYGVISALYLMCKNPHFAELENAGFKFINMTGEN